MKKNVLIFLASLTVFFCAGQKPARFNGLDMNLGNLFRLSDARTRSIGPENLTGEPGKGSMATLENGSARNNARDLGQGWKVNPYVQIKAGETFTMEDISGPGAFTTPAGGEKGRSNSSWTEIPGFRPSTVQEPRIISAVPMILRWIDATRNFQPLMPVCRR